MDAGVEEVRKLMETYLRHVAGGIASQQPSDESISRLLESLEDTCDFADLAVACYHAIPVRNDRLYRAPPSARGWGQALKEFFRNSGVYMNILRGQPESPDAVMHRLLLEARRDICTVTYLALVDLVEVGAKEVRFGDYSFSYLDRKRLGAFLKEDVRRLFYPQRLVGTETFANHHYLVAHRERPSGMKGTLEERDFSFVTVPLRPTTMARAVERGLRVLALYNWQPIWAEEDKKCEKTMRSGWPGLTVPAVIVVTDDLFHAPEWLPQHAEILMLPILDQQGNEIGERPHQPVFEIAEAEAEKFEEFVQEMDHALNRLLVDDSAQFLHIAADSMLKGALSEGLDQLLSHVVALEAVFGPGKMDVESKNQCLRRRIARVLKAPERRKAMQHQVSELYGLRSAFVHGDAAQNKQIYRGQLADARDISRAVVVWAIRAFADLQSKAAAREELQPTRDDLLRLVDLDEADRLRLAAHASWLKGQYPYVPEWLG
jgi:hypothetical protein